MTDKLLWKRGPWEIRKTGNGRIRVDDDMHSHSDWPILHKSNSRPWYIAWDRPEGKPKDVIAKVKSILIKREME